MIAKRSRVEGVTSLMEQLNRKIYANEGPTGLQAAQWSALRFFSKTGEMTRTVTGLATFMGITSGPASRSVRALVGRGYLRDDKNPHDKRSTLFYVTDEGMEKLKNDPLLKLQNSIEHLNDDELSDLADVLIKLTDDLTEAQGTH